ncbi:hypothetical protein JANAI62_36870 [Jannaschia pagri]|uniref:Uncharacterized protein n=1 Tax=Jannaschia pagri TaxID=2829797 RepID=A0ABQ4NS38_9RHOB|nr:hypothetical protein JANAI61_37280 [Jannaschia sp. AI_61]GIT97064.1 hypothetical protein JANAI62_36870 [Jannaschia sp. AI_62]
MDGAGFDGIERFPENRPDKAVVARLPVLGVVELFPVLGTTVEVGDLIIIRPVEAGPIETEEELKNAVASSPS